MAELASSLGVLSTTCRRAHLTSRENIKADSELSPLELARVKGTEGRQSVACWDRPCRPAGYREISRHSRV